MKYGIIIQARLSSKRLPGKVLKKINGKALIELQVERLSYFIKNIPIIVATSNSSSDKKLVEFCKRKKINVFTGPLNNVVKRFVQCCDSYNLDSFVRVGGDDPLIDPDCCIKLIQMHKRKYHDLIYASHRKGWPYGAAAELISVKALKKVLSISKNKEDLEHTIPFFFNNQKMFKIKKCFSPKSIRRDKYFLSIDYKEDFRIVKEVVKNIGKKSIYFEFKKMINFMDNNKNLLNINKHLQTGFDK